MSGSEVRSGRTARLTAVLALAMLSSGCAVAAAAGAAIAVIGAVVGTGVKVAGKVIEKTFDIVTPDASSAP